MALPTTVSYVDPKSSVRVQGANSLSAVGDATIISAPSGTGKAIYLQKAIVTVSSVGGGGIIALEDGAGGTRLAEWSAVGHYVLDFGEQGLKLSDNTALNLTVETADSTAYCTAVGFVNLP